MKEQLMALAQMYVYNDACDKDAVSYIPVLIVYYKFFTTVVSVYLELYS